MVAPDGPVGDGPDVVVVLSYHGREDTERCVESLVDGSPGARVLVVDNGSFDGVLERVAERWPQVATLQTGTNLGFAGGMNRGVAWALRNRADTITVLNNDTLVSPGAIAALARIARAGVAVSPEVRYADGSERVWFGGGVVDGATSLARHLSEGELRALPSSAAGGFRRSEVLAGCCITATAGTWQRVGPFDERYFLMFEDSDWSLRATRAGIPLVVSTDVVIHHRVSASFTGSYSYLGLYYYARNGLLFGAGRRPWALRARVLFLRRHVVPVLGRDVREGNWREAVRRSLIAGIAVASHVVRRYGRAPRWLEALASSWSASASARK